jgi:hypothetical protein
VSLYVPSFHHVLVRRVSTWIGSVMMTPPVSTPAGALTLDEVSNVLGVKRAPMAIVAVPTADVVAKVVANSVTDRDGSSTVAVVAHVDGVTVAFGGGP